MHTNAYGAPLSVWRRLIRKARDGDDLKRHDFINVAWGTDGILGFLRRYDDRYGGCGDCGLFTPWLEGTETGEVCKGCYENYAPCDCCGESVEASDLSPVTANRHRRTVEESWCPSCVDSQAFQCHACEGHFEGAPCAVAQGGHDLCQICYGDDFFTCEGCDEVLPDSRHAGDGYCGDCEDGRTCGAIRPYGTEAESELDWGAPEPVGRYVKDKLWFGMELEMEAPDSGRRASQAEAFLDAFQGEAILCEDGSLEDGFEVKAPPLNAADLGRLAGRIADWAQGRPLMSHDSGRCGCHIHITRKALSPLQQAKIHEFVNKPANAPLIRAVARRYDNSYAQVEPEAKRTDINKTWRGKADWQGNPLNHKAKVYYAKGSLYKLDRRMAVNPTPATLELRFYRGTLKKPSLLACLEFSHALVTYTRTGECVNHALDTAEFLGWLKGKPDKLKAWGNLCRVLVAKGVLEVSVLPRACLKGQALTEVA